MSERLFAYGSLLRGLGPPDWMARSQAWHWLGPASVPGRLYDFGEYPGAVLDPAAPGRIRGELALLPEDRGLWRELDAYEGWRPESPGASLFRRVRCRVRLDAGGCFAAWVYRVLRDPAEGRPIPDGRYRGRD